MKNSVRIASLLPFLAAGCGDANDQGFVDTFSVNDRVSSALVTEGETDLEDGRYLYVVSTGVSSAHLDLNDVRLLGPSDFKNRGFERTFDVELEDENTIEVSLRGSPGDQLCVSVFEIDSSDSEEPERVIYERCVDREAGPPNVVSEGF